MDSNVEDGKRILESVLEYIKERGATLLPWVNYSMDKNDLTFFLQKEDGKLTWPILSFDYRPDRSLLAFRFAFPFSISKEETPKALEILNHLNNCNFETNLSISQKTGLISIHEGMLVTGGSLDMEAFKLRFGRFLIHVRSYQPLFLDERFPDLEILSDLNLRWKGGVL
jgi:hypothetical protein